MAKWKAQFRYSTAPGDPEKYPYLVSADITQAGRIIGAATVRPDLPAEKNAHLMAAAPDLLEACEAAFDNIRREYERMPDSYWRELAADVREHGREPTGIVAYFALRSALAKAKGEV